jgi:hypothetical protein
MKESNNITFKQFDAIYKFLLKTNADLAEDVISEFALKFRLALMGKNKGAEIDNKIEEEERKLEVLKKIRDFRNRLLAE